MHFPDESDNVMYYGNIISGYVKTVTYIRVTRNSNEIPIVNSNNVVVHCTQVNRYHLSTRFVFTADLEYTA